MTRPDEPAIGTVARSPPTRRPALRGAFTALVTPFTADGDVDEAAYRALAEWQVLAGIDGLVPVGTTGEAPDPVRRPSATGCIEIAVAAAAASAAPARPPVVAGTGTNDTRASIEATRRAAALGADAALVVAPYYNRPDQRMLDAHFRAIADEGGLPIVVYNVPSRTGTNVEADTFLRLAEHPRVIAVKEASGNIEQIAVICRDRPRDVAVLAGDDAATLAVLAMGGDGVVSGGRQRGPGRARGAVRRRARRRLGRGAADPRPAGCPCSAPTSRARPTRSRPRPRCSRWACSSATTVRAPLLPLGRRAARARSSSCSARSGSSTAAGGVHGGSAPRRAAPGATVAGRSRMTALDARRRTSPRPRSSTTSTRARRRAADPGPRRARRLARRPRGQGGDPRPVPRPRDDRRGTSAARSRSATASGCRSSACSTARGAAASTPAARGGSCPAGPASAPASTSARAS